ncbi:type II toxin-antitoxin system HigB family toxin [Patescibacteria group bacterium]|nr:type II toxin-antitoxin system HigB family toxin [Patescibacteria group bacterium]
MRLIGVKVLHDYQLHHADISSRLDSWIQEVEEAQWMTTHDVKARYSSADFFENRYVVINLKGNKYRLLFQVDYQRKTVRVKAIGAHSEYSKWKLE